MSKWENEEEGKVGREGARGGGGERDRQTDRMGKALTFFSFQASPRGGNRI